MFRFKVWFFAIRFSIIFSWIFSCLIGFYHFFEKTFLWSIKKNKWIAGPKLPYLKGIEESCATLLNRSVVMIIGMTRIKGRQFMTAQSISLFTMWFYIFSEELHYVRKLKTTSFHCNYLLRFNYPIYKTTNVCPMLPFFSESAPPILMKLGIPSIHTVKMVLK